MPWTLTLSSCRAGAIRSGRATNLRMGTKFDKGRKMRVAVVGGGPSGACAAEIFAQVSQDRFRCARATQRLLAYCVRAESCRCNTQPCGCPLRLVVLRACCSHVSIGA